MYLTVFLTDKCNFNKEKFLCLAVRKENAGKSITINEKRKDAPIAIRRKNNFL